MIISVLAALLPSARAKTVDGYFLFERRLDLDSFLKTSVGYSLQAASIVLFFQWGISYGLWAAIVPFAWGLGYWILARIVERGGFDKFLGKSVKDGSETIHGHVWSHLKNPASVWSRLAVLLISASTVIGLGGTLVVEVDYGAKIFLGAAKITAIPTWQVTGLVVAFAAFYILWGGYRAVVVTDRVQVPLAYLAFGIVALGLIYMLGSSALGVTFATTFFLAFSVLLFNRLRILPADDYHNRSVAWATFAPLALLGAAILILPEPSIATKELDLKTALLPSVKDSLGFGILGAASLFVANAVWQFIDISSLQRLQSVDIDANGPSGVARAIRATGFEAAIGWLLLLLAAIAARASGVDDFAKLTDFLAALAFPLNLMLPLFVFSAVVFVLSTVSGFVSAIAFVAYFDFLAIMGLHKRTETPSSLHASKMNGDGAGEHVLLRARVTSIGIVLLLFVAYEIMKISLEARSKPGEDLISAALYAIYAFQLSIAPTVFYVLFSRQLHDGVKLSPTPVILSCATGLAFAWLTATSTVPWFGLPDASWYVIPPLAVAVSSMLVFVISQSASRWFEGNRDVV
jgi:hypothetical protein